ncbi:hypothetical protein HPT27_11500 [Permianibacter sp. IMCC34836]|uniref:ImmA/IrrE family metallo-endopeptidase n=1 Tax=Permianibacter fluminis TaxID=2738515 RepID=UPI00155741AD|nr:hypothetical protein [Permianibacter fluminis]NQD37651.1 hypothetical protein [Permianibacter fluminis]
MTATTVPSLTPTQLYQQLQKQGFPRSFVERLLPEWWDDGLLKTSSGLLELAVILRRRTAAELQIGVDGRVTLAPPGQPMRFKKRSTTGEHDLHVASQLALAIARIAVTAAPRYQPLPTDAIALRNAALASSKRPALDFAGLVSYCWQNGVPVLFLKHLPANRRRMAGVALRVQQRPVVVLGYQDANPSKQLFVLAHELGHLQRGHVADDQLLLDERMDQIEASLRDGENDKDEVAADAYAFELLRGAAADLVAQLPATGTASALTLTALQLEKHHGVDAGHLLWSYAYTSKDWVRANMAVDFLPMRKTTAFEVLETIQREAMQQAALPPEELNYLLTMQGFSFAKD